MNNIIEKLKENKKRIIKGALVFAVVVVGLSVAGGAVLYKIVKSNINYTEKQAIELALKQVPGSVVSVRKELELERFTLDYNINIKDKNNVITEVVVDSKLGAIVDFDNYMFND